MAWKQRRQALERGRSGNAGKKLLDKEEDAVLLKFVIHFLILLTVTVNTI
jgi:hypothetical protein